MPLQKKKPILRPPQHTTMNHTVHHAWPPPERGPPVWMPPPLAVPCIATHSLKPTPKKWSRRTAPRAPVVPTTPIHTPDTPSGTTQKQTTIRLANKHSLFDMAITEFNAYVKKHNISNHAELRQARRQHKNKLYARKSRANKHGRSTHVHTHLRGRNTAHGQPKRGNPRV